MYMLDTTDYQRDYTEFYTSWHSRENLYLRDVIYEQSCSAVDFQGDYVSPKFFLHYLIGDEKNIKKLSGKDTVRMIHVHSIIRVLCSLQKKIILLFIFPILMVVVVNSILIVFLLPISLRNPF